MHTWDDISRDFIDALPKVSGKYVLYIVVDRFSMYAHFIPLYHSYCADYVAHVFFTHIFRLHRLLDTIVCDRDPFFSSSF